MLPVQPTGPAISLELDVDDGEVENYEVGLFLPVCLYVCLRQILILLVFLFCSVNAGPPEPRRASRRGQTPRTDKGRH